MAKFTEELYKKDLHDTDNHDGVITHLEPDILECEVKWALGNVTMNKASGGDWIPAKLFQILKHNVVKVLHSIHQQIWKTRPWPQDWKRSSQPKREAMPKNAQTTTTIALISYDRKVMLKILQVRLQQSWTVNFQMFKLVLEKAEESKIKLPTSAGSSKKTREFQKNTYFCFIDYTKAV